MGTHVVQIIAIIFCGLTLSVIAEWMGMNFLWPDQRDHAQRMLVTEIQYLNADFVIAASGITGLSSVAYDYTVGAIEPILIAAGDSVGVGKYAASAVASTQLFFVRLAILTFSFPVFILFLIVGVTSGLTLRDIRRWSGGREYGGVYHRAKWLAPKALFSAWVIYLAMPVSVHPSLVILPCAILFSINMMVMSSSFKKYL